MDPLEEKNGQFLNSDVLQNLLAAVRRDVSAANVQARSGEGMCERREVGETEVRRKYRESDRKWSFVRS